MNTQPNEKYNPAEDDNQGVTQLMAQAEQANGGAGVEQAPQLSMTENVGEGNAAPVPADEPVEIDGETASKKDMAGETDPISPS